LVGGQARRVGLSQSLRGPLALFGIRRAYDERDLRMAASEAQKARGQQTKTHLALDGLSFFQRYGFTYVNQYTSFISRINYEIVNKPIGCNYFVHMALNYFCVRDNKSGN